MPIEEDFISTESICARCFKNGETRLLPNTGSDGNTFVVASFSCGSCEYSNNEVIDASGIADLGCNITLSSKSPKDLLRKVLITEWASIRIENIDLEIPRGSPIITTIEGIFLNVISGLSCDQELRKVHQPELYEKINVLVEKLTEYAEGKHPFVIAIDDPSGKSKIESFDPTKGDESLQTVKYSRSLEQMKLLGFEDDLYHNDHIEDIYTFRDSCPCCSFRCETHMKKVDIPFFKEVIIMCTSCGHCGYKSNDVKTGGSISAKGKKISLNMNSSDDLNRDILVSETCKVEIPDLNFETLGGSCGGKFTTLEGLFDFILTELQEKVSLHIGDSSAQKERFSKLLSSLSDIKEGKKYTRIVLSDPMANSFVQNIFAPEDDPNMEITEYERSFDENEFLGLNDLEV